MLSQIRFNVQGVPLKKANLESASKYMEVVHRDPLGLQEGIPEGYTLGECVVLLRSSLVQQRTLAMKLLTEIISRSRAGLVTGQKLFESFQVDGLLSPLFWSDVWHFILEMGDIIAMIRIGLDHNKMQVLTASLKALSALLAPNEYDLAAMKASHGSGIIFPLFSESSCRRNQANKTWTCLTASQFPSSIDTQYLNIHSKFSLSTTSQHLLSDHVSDQELFAENFVSCLINTSLLDRLGVLLNLLRKSDFSFELIMLILRGLILSGKHVASTLINHHGIMTQILETLCLSVSYQIFPIVMTIINSLLLLSPSGFRLLLNQKILCKIIQLFVELEQVSKDLIAFDQTCAINLILYESIKLCQSEVIQRIWTNKFNVLYFAFEKILSNLPSGNIGWSEAKNDLLSRSREALCSFEALLLCTSCSSSDTIGQGYAISPLFMVKVLVIVKNRTIWPKGSVIYNALDCPMYVLPTVSAALSFLASALLSNRNYYDLLYFSSMEAKFIIKFYRFGAKRLMHKVLDSWRFAIFGKNTWKNLLLGASLSSVITSILKILTSFELKKNRHTAPLSTSLTSYVFDYVAPEFFEHFQSLGSKQKDVITTLTKHLSGELLKITSNDLSILQLWQISLMCTFNNSSEISAGDINKTLSVAQISSYLQNFFHLSQALAPGSEKILLKSHFRLYENKGVFSLYKLTMEDLSAFMAGISNSSYICKNMITNKNWTSPYVQIASQISWKYYFKEDSINLQSGSLPDLLSKRQHTENKTFKRANLPTSNSKFMNHYSRTLISVYNSSYPRTKNWWILKFCYKHCKCQKIKHSIKKNTVDCKYESTGLLLYISILHLSLQKDHLYQIMSAILTNLYGIDKEKEYWLKEGTRLSCGLITWKYLESMPSTSRISLSNSMTISIVDRFITSSNCDNIFGIHMLLLISRWASPKMREDTWKKLADFRLLGLLPNKNFMSNILENIGTKVSLCDKNKQDLSLFLSCCNYLFDNTIKSTVRVNSLSRTYAESVVRLYLLISIKSKPRYEIKSLKNWIINSDHDDILYREYRKIIITGSVTSWCQTITKL